MDDRAALDRAAAWAAAYLETLGERRVAADATADELRATLGGPLPDGPADPVRVVDELADAAEPGLVASSSGRYFGFVVGGSLPASVAADWLASAWDQNAGLAALGPAAAVVEEVCGRWLAELLGLPAGVSFGLTTGCQMAHVTALAAARRGVLAREGWDVELEGLCGAPRIRVVVGEERHVTVDRALRLLGIGTSAIVPVAADRQGRMRPEALAAALGPCDEPTIVCAQVGNVNTGAVDPLHPIADLTEDAGAWLHVDGAFGMWAAASPSRRRLVDGIERADSWATDAHKWLNVPYDCGLAFTRHPQLHRGAMGVDASYLLKGDGERDPSDWVPDASRRARGFAVYAAIRSLGRSGIAELVDRCCDHARRFAAELGADPEVDVLNEVVLNQALVRFADSDEVTAEVVRCVQDDGTCWLGGTTWQGRGAMRISVSSWRTTSADVERSIAAIRRAAAGVLGARV